MYEGLQTLGEGAILVGLVLGTMVTHVLEKKFLDAAIACVAYSLLTGAKDPVTSTSPT